MLAADNWCVKVDERVYGPYSSTQLRKFAHEGRLAAWSLIAPAGSRNWREARDEPNFAAFFGFEPSGAAASSAPAFGKRDASCVDAGVATSRNHAAVSKGPSPKRTAHVAPEGEPSQSNFILIFDVVSAAASRVETAVLSLGPGFKVAENVWTVRCELTAIGVRNAIAPFLHPRESIMVIDATRGRTSWQNFAPETHAKIAAAWAATRA